MAVVLLNRLGEIGGCVGGDVACTTPVPDFLGERWLLTSSYEEVLR
jgi:hypothetical protein